MLKETMWPPPEGKLRGAVVRTRAERERSRKEASVVLATLVPDLAGNVVGRMNAKEAARRMAAVLNNGRLMGHLAYMILDEVVAVLFGDSAGVVNGGGRVR